MPNQIPKLTISENAAKRIKELQSKDQAKKFFRITIEGGGCNGFQYIFSFDNAQQEGDLLIQDKGVSALVDSMSFEFLDQSEVDFVEEMVGKYFQINNPNAASSCGCGNSFSI